MEFNDCVKEMVFMTDMMREREDESKRCVDAERVRSTDAVRGIKSKRYQLFLNTLVPSVASFVYICNLVKLRFH